MNKKNKMISSEMEELMEEKGWRVENNNKYVEINQFSPKGHDFTIGMSGIVDDKDFLNQLEGYYMDYEPAEEALHWVDSEGQGINGAPGDLDTVVKDLEDAKAMLNDLLDDLCVFIENDIEL